MFLNNEGTCNEKSNKLIADLKSTPIGLLSSIYSLEIGDKIYVNKILNPTGYSFAIKNITGDVFSKKDGAFYLELSPSNRDDNYFQEFRYNSLEEAIESYYSFK